MKAIQNLQVSVPWATMAAALLALDGLALLLACPAAPATSVKVCDTPLAKMLLLVDGLLGLLLAFAQVGSQMRHNEAVDGL